MLFISRAWEKPVYIGDGELGKPRVAVSIDYKEWRSGRGVPQLSAQDVLTSTNKELQENVEALTKKLEIIIAQLRILEDKEEESSLVIDALQRQCKKKDQEIEQLKDECAATHEEVTRATKIQKVDSGNQLQEALKKIAQLKAERAQQAQLIKMVQDDLTLNRSDALKWWEIAQKRTTSLLEFKKKDKKGLEQMRQICEEKDRAIDKTNELDVLIRYYQKKAKEAHTTSEDMDRAVHAQVEAMARHSKRMKTNCINIITHLWGSSSFFVSPLVVKINKGEGPDVKPLRITAPSLFPYESDKAIPRVYDIQATTDSDVTNIVGIGGMTRSGRIYTPDNLQDKAPKEKARTEEIGKEPEEETNELLKYIRQSEYSVIDQLNRTPRSLFFH
ncbi:hypothetical protein Fmac_026670 [Flemingia macrophylla]|uniref:Uncharacterized protein n=1 Tax=Flemingia macrophylla TaxID=520843 RepID=A0ABD1LFP6_9FABA